MNKEELRRLALQSMMQNQNKEDKKKQVGTGTASEKEEGEITNNKQVKINKI